MNRRIFIFDFSSGLHHFRRQYDIKVFVTDIQKILYMRHNSFRDLVFASFNHDELRQMRFEIDKSAREQIYGE